MAARGAGDVTGVFPLDGAAAVAVAAAVIEAAVPRDLGVEVVGESSELRDLGSDNDDRAEDTHCTESTSFRTKRHELLKHTLVLYLSTHGHMDKTHQV